MSSQSPSMDDRSMDDLGPQPGPLNPYDDDHLREECGIFGIYGNPDAAANTVLGLHALQHRGQEAAGVVTFYNGRFNGHRALGHVAPNFSSEKVIRDLPGDAAIGHVRYSTSGDTLLRNVQPIYADLTFGGFAVAHNGNLTNALTLRNQLVDRLIDALLQIEGAYSLVALTAKKLIGVRDPNGVRPLVLGNLKGAPILASETCALDILGADYVRDVEPGEVLVIDQDGIHSFMPFPRSQKRFCIFEYIYFARPDSVVEGHSVYNSRKRIGAVLAQESGVDADVVIPVPDSGVPAAIGYAQASGVPFELGIIRNHYVGRTFIEPTDKIRHFGVKLKHNANRVHIEGKRVILVDDSIVRGTTSTKIVEMVREAGAAEVHMRIASPPTTHSCFYGIDTPERSKLLAATHDIEQMRQFIRADSLAFIAIS